VSEAVLQAKIKAFDEFSTMFQKFQQELKKTEQSSNQAAKGTDTMNKSVSNLFQVMGQMGALYAFQRGLREVMNTGREFELAIKQAQAVTGDLTSTLHDAAMASNGVYGPTELAKAYYELGSAGLNANEAIKATSDILDFAAAGMIKMDEAAYAVTSTVKAFGLEWGQTTQVVDAFTQAMNSTAMKAQDFQWVMSSVGAVGKMAGQDFKEVIAGAAAMRDAGVQAQDAGTSIKAALVALMNPSKEANQIIDKLKINIYDASGKMKQWHEIISEFERVLAPYNEQSRNFILTTVAGTDGVRALATGLNMGGTKLAEYVNQMGNADGATKSMAGTMNNSFNGAMLKVNADLERMSDLIFEDTQSISTGLLGVIDTLIIGFNNMDESERAVVEGIIGTYGLILAVSSLVTVLRTLGITMAMITGPIGITLMAITALSGAVMLYKGHQEQLSQELKESIGTNLNQAKSIEMLLSKYEELAGKSNKTASEEQELKNTIQKLTDAVPAAITGFDAMGTAITNIETASEAARAKLAELRQEAVRNTQLNASIAKTQLPQLQQNAGDAKAELDRLQAYISGGNPSGAYLDAQEGMRGWRQLSSLWKDNNEIAYEAGNLAKSAKDKYESANKELIAAQEAIRIANELAAGNDPFTTKAPETGGGKTGGGTKAWTAPNDKQAANQAKAFTEAITEALYPYKAATDAAANSVAALGAKEQYLSQVMQSSQGTVNQAIELNKVRTQQYGALAQQQEAMHQQADAERVALAVLQQKYQQATDPDAIKELQSEMTNLIGSINQAGQAWWQAEQQKLSITEQVKQADDKRYTDAYQQAMDLMRHQVNMAQMSTDQQISYLEKLRDAHKWSTQQMWELDEQLYSLRKQQLNEYLSIMEDEYNSKLDAVTAKTKATTDAIQSQINALDKEGTQSDRTETTRQHNQKLQDLLDQRHYHELRTGKEHKTAIEDLDKQIAEEQLSYQQQQEKWARDDKKDALQQQLEDAKQAGEDEKKRLEDHYKEVMKLANQGALDTLAALAAKNPEWLEIGKNWIKNLMDGITAMEPEFQAKIQEATSQMGGYQSTATSTTTTSPNIPSADTVPSNYQDALVYYQSHLNEALAEIQRAGTVYSQKMAAGDKDGAAAAHKWADQVRKAIGQSMIFDSNTESSPSVHNSYAKGGPIFYDQIARLHAGEYVLPANLVEAIRMMNPPTGRSNYSSQGGGETVIHNEQNYYGPLVGVDKQYINDETDNQLWAREVVGLQKSVVKTRGR